MENHHPSSTSTSHSYHHQSLPFSNNFLLDPHEEQQEKPLTTLPIFDSTSTLHVPSVDILHTNNVMYNQPHKNPKRKRSRFLKITSPTCSSGGGGVSKPKITKKPPDPSAPKITRPCTECGKKFWSWKALFGHMRCHPERQWRGINPPPNFRTRQHNHVDDSPNSASEFSPSPRKNIKLLSDTIMTDEDYEVAACLLQLANGSSKPDEINVNNEEPPDNENVVKDNVVVASEDNQRCLTKDNRFECSGCKKVFGSHQALGGHRASHKNVKGCFASASGSGSGSGLTQAAVVVSPIKAHNDDTDIANLDLNFPPPVTLIISGEDQYDSSSSYSWTYSGSGLDLRLKL